MWLSLNILSKMVDINDLTPEEIADKLTMSTAEIEEIDYLNHHLKTIITAKAEDVKKHPNADKLTIVDINNGTERIPVVCGAQNHKTGDIVALATIGTKFSEEFIVKKTKIRGEESIGMLCSEREMGLSDSHEGILILPPDTKLGVPLSEIYPHWVDTRLEIDNKSITHRPDLWSYAGFAREIGAIFNRPVNYPVNYDIEESLGNEKSLEIEILNPEMCPRYSALIIDNIKIEESPIWLQAMVTSIGMRPINNIVDITNYVMAELGEPMHAFDSKKLNGNKIIVRTAKKGEKLTTLDETAHELTEEDIIISDIKGPIALAGVMGGGNSEIDENTTSIVLEAANFDPVAIRKTAHRFNSRTEAAIRFEKSLSSELTKDALLRCYELIKEIIPESKAVSQILDCYPVKNKDIIIKTTTDYIRKNLGESQPDRVIIDILSSLGFEIKDNDGALAIKVPHYRATKDISIPDDIVEEVGRIYGYDNIVSIAPLVPCKSPEENLFRLFERKIKNILSLDYNMTEAMGYSFIGEEILNKLEINEDKELRLKNALSQEHDRLRRSIFPNILENIQLNSKYRENFAVYEFGRVFQKNDRKSGDLIGQGFRVTGAVYKKNSSEPLFYDAKTIATGLIEKLKLRKVRLMPVSDNLPVYAHPGRSMRVEIKGEEVGLIFELHPKVAKKFDIPGHSAFFDLDMELFFSAPRGELEFNNLQKFPEVPFDISLLADKKIYSEDICKIILNSNQKYIKSAVVTSIYEGEQIDLNKKSVSIKTIFSAKDKTLDADEIEKIQNKIIADLDKKGFKIR